MNAPLSDEARFRCGVCDARFATKGQKRRHKQTGCKTSEMSEFVQGNEDRCDDADLYGRYRPTPEVIARANAEWEAMDWRGRLPKGWTYEEPDAAIRRFA